MLKNVALPVFLVCSFMLQVLQAQENFFYRDHIYADNIKSVLFHVNGLYTSYPILDLDKPGQLKLSFDDLNGGSKYFYYKIIHCDADWNPSDLEYYDYIDGYEEEEIRDFAYSVNTLTDYTHYSLLIPNDNMSWTKSGNYLLVIFEDAGDRPVIITRRFMVVDIRVPVFPEMVQPANVARFNTHQEIDFELDVEHINVSNPKNDIKAVVMQNGRWDNAYTGLESRYERGSRLVFDYLDKIIFPAGRNFRYVDIRSLRYRSRNVFEISQVDDRISVIMAKDKPRGYGTYLEDIDLNGKFVIQTVDNMERAQRRVQREVEFGDSTYLLEVVQSVTNEDMTEAYYVEVTFTLEMPDPLDSDVYIFGQLSDWEMKPEFRMEYNDFRRAYMGTVLLKQGYYDYMYVREDSQGRPDADYIEGNWYEADNDYTILVYYKPFGSRYDQLVAAKTIDSGY